MPAGQTPHSVVLFTYNDLVDTIQPGDRITVTGIYRAVPLQVSVKLLYKNLYNCQIVCKIVLYFTYVK